jgi:hypothetical protein
MMSHRILSAALLLCTLAACGDLPTHSETQAQPAGPAYDGFTMGSGNKTEEDGGSTTDPGAAETHDGGYGMGSGNIAVEGGAGTLESGLMNSTADGDSTGRGGYGMGSGN